MSVQAPLKQSERQFERAIKEYAAFLGWLVYHPYSSRRSTPGWPDLAMARDGRLVLAELKTNKGRVSPDQRGWLQALGYYEEHLRLLAAEQDERDYPRLMTCLWRPQDWPEVKKVLR